MEENRILTTDLENILSMIVCADDYGFNNNVVMDFFAGLMNRKLTDEEIEGYSKGILEDKRYTEEDYAATKSILEGFKRRFITPKD